MILNIFFDSIGIGTSHRVPKLSPQTLEKIHPDLKDVIKMLFSKY